LQHLKISAQKKGLHTN